MLSPINPVVLKGSSKNAFNKLGTIFDKTYTPKIVVADTGKNFIFVARYLADSPNLHFQVYNRQCKMTDTFVLAQNKSGNGCEIKKYSAFQNKVMRPRDIEVSPDKDMSFEQILQHRPVIVKRIESLLAATTEALNKKYSG